MTIKVAINGYGRIGRNILRALYESAHARDLQIVAVNDLGDVATNAHLTSTTPRTASSPARWRPMATALVVNGDRIKVLAVRNPAELPWKALGVGRGARVHRPVHQQGQDAGATSTAGAKKVIICAPGEKDVDATIVYGVNHERAEGQRTR